MRLLKALDCAGKQNHLHLVQNLFVQLASVYAGRKHNVPEGHAIHGPKHPRCVCLFNAGCISEKQHEHEAMKSFQRFQPCLAHSAGSPHAWVGHTEKTLTLCICVCFLAPVLAPLPQCTLTGAMSLAHHVLLENMLKASQLSSGALPRPEPIMGRVQNFIMEILWVFRGSNVWVDWLGDAFSMI